jgi:probable O-glycosylation ligase (exosortase A-associated)
MLMIVPLFLSLASATSNKWAKLAYRFLAIGIAYRALTTYSRGGLLAFVAMLVLYWIRSRNKIIILCVTLALAALILPVFPEAFWQRMKTIKTSQSEMDASSAGRVYFWKIGIKMANANPLLGVGLGGFPAAYNSFDPSHGSLGEDRSVHSAWFGVLAENGYPGLLVFVLIFLQSWYGCIHARRLCNSDEPGNALKQYTIAIETGLLVAAVGSTFLSFQYIEMLWHFFGISIAVERIALTAVKSQKNAFPSVELKPNSTEFQLQTAGKL